MQLKEKARERPKREVGLSVISYEWVSDGENNVSMEEPNPNCGNK